MGSYGAKKVPKRRSYTVHHKLKAVVAAKMKSRYINVELASKVHNTSPQYKPGLN